MSNLDPKKSPLERARHLSEFLCEGGPEDFSVSPEEAAVARQLQDELVNRLRTVHHSQWTRPELKRRTFPEQQEAQPTATEPLKITAP